MNFYECIYKYIVLLTIFGLIFFGSSPLSSVSLMFMSLFIVALPLYAIFTDSSKKITDFTSATGKWFDLYFMLRLLVPTIIIVILSLVAYGISVINGDTAACGAAFIVLCFGEIANAVCILKADSIFNKNMLNKNASVIICLATLIFLLLFVITPIGTLLSVSGFAPGGWILSILALVLVILSNEIIKFNKNRF